jgi:hypothetical protein
VRVKSDQCRVLVLGRSVFKRILGDINKYLKKDYDGEFDKQYQQYSQEKIRSNINWKASSFEGAAAEGE